MFGVSDLKSTLDVTATTVACPVAGCEHTVRRQRKKDLFRSERFYCQDHHIYISPSTFEYAEESDNLLWADTDDLALLSKIKAPGVKRESRIARDNSEDAVTWNVFRHLERCDLLESFVDLTWGHSIANAPCLIYWSYCQNSCAVWNELVDAAPHFGERVSRRSEPDLIIDDNNVLLFIENKFGSGNSTKPSNPDDPKRYVIGCNRWFSQVFKSGTTFKTIAVDDRLYELMRLWLIGSWIADQARKSFCLVNIVRKSAKEDTNIESQFGRHVAPNEGRQFVRLTWEQLHRQFVDGRTDPNSQRLGQYFKEKSLGYSISKRNGREQGRLRRAFDIP